MAAPFILVSLVSLSNKTGLFRAVDRHAWDFVVLAVGSVAITLLGVADDVRGMRARHKLLGQILVATMVASSGYAIEAVNIPFIGVIDLRFFWGLGGLLTVFWIVGIINAVNLIDGMDGLATGVSLISAVTLAMLAGLNGNPFVVLLCIALAGSLLAFLRFNWHPASIFLGDTGSMFLGFALATLSLMGSCKAQGAVLMLGAVMALGIPIFETLISILRRYAGGFPIFSADARHTHHRLLYMGMSQRQAAGVLYAGGLLCLAAAVLEVVLPKESAQSLIPSGIFVVTLLSIAVVAGYTRTIVAKFRLRQETMRHLAFARYATMTLVPGATHETVSRLMGLICEEFALDYIGVEFDGGGARISSVGLPGNPGAAAHSRPTERISVKASNGGRVEVVFQHSREVGPIESHTSAACLVRIFDGISAEFLEAMAPRAQQEELLPGIAKRLSHVSEGAGEERPVAARHATVAVSAQRLKDGTPVEYTN